MFGYLVVSIETTEAKHHEGSGALAIKVIYECLFSCPIYFKKPTICNRSYSLMLPKIGQHGWAKMNARTTFM